MKKGRESGANKIPNRITMALELQIAHSSLTFQSRLQRAHKHLEKRYWLRKREKQEGEEALGITPRGWQGRETRGCCNRGQGRRQGKGKLRARGGPVGGSGGRWV